MSRFVSRLGRAFPLAFCLAVFTPAYALACACGCTVFDVGTSSLMPAGPGGTAFLEYDWLDQTRNFSGTSRAPATGNDDKRINSNFFVAGAQYMFNEKWGVMAQVPFTSRRLETTEPGSYSVFDHSSLGDIRLMGVYSGFSPDMSTGVTFGVKLPTGDHRFAGFDADVQIGSGSTDVLLGLYHTGALSVDGRWNYYAQALWQHEIATQDGYTPGSELNGSVGASYELFRMGNVAISPMLQMIVSRRGHDSGAAGEADETGYTRALVAPGLQADFGTWKLYGDVELPVYQHVTGEQLIAPVAVKFIASFVF